MEQPPLNISQLEAQMLEDIQVITQDTRLLNQRDLYLTRNIKKQSKQVRDRAKVLKIVEALFGKGVGVEEGEILLRGRIEEKKQLLRQSRTFDGGNGNERTGKDEVVGGNNFKTTSLNSASSYHLPVQRPVSRSQGNGGSVNGLGSNCRDKSRSNCTASAPGKVGGSRCEEAVVPKQQGTSKSLNKIIADPDGALANLLQTIQVQKNQDFQSAPVYVDPRSFKKPKDSMSKADIEKIPYYRDLYDKIDRMIASNLRRAEHRALRPAFCARRLKDMFRNLGITQKLFTFCVVEIGQGKFSDLINKPPGEDWILLRENVKNLFRRIYAFLTTKEAIEFLYFNVGKTHGNILPIIEMVREEAYWVKKPANFTKADEQPIGYKPTRSWEKNELGGKCKALVNDNNVYQLAPKADKQTLKSLRPLVDEVAEDGEIEEIKIKEEYIEIVPFTKSFQEAQREKQGLKRKLNPEPTLPKLTTTKPNQTEKKFFFNTPDSEPTPESGDEKTVLSANALLQQMIKDL
uniref:CUT domain-containing protein n=1 Tax=Rhabditophanes sp. KR3021 TaxID=114890 RepID=A0AC35TI08_9BILA